MKVIKYDKIVRDNIPKIIEANGKTCKVKFLEKDEKIKYLIKKLKEEVDEFAMAKTYEELADVYEVLDALITELDFDFTKLKEVKENKKNKNGGFSKGILLMEVLEN